jgi:hypothetical protein
MRLFLKLGEMFDCSMSKCLVLLLLLLCGDCNESMLLVLVLADDYGGNFFLFVWIIIVGIVSNKEMVY